MSQLVWSKAYLNSNFWEVDFHGQLFSTVHVGVVGLLKGALELVQLIGREGGSVASVFLFRLILIGSIRGTAVTLHIAPWISQICVTLLRGEKPSICSTGIDRRAALYFSGTLVKSIKELVCC